MKIKQYLHNVQMWESGEISFQGLAIHRVGVKLPFQILQTERTRDPTFQQSGMAQATDFEISYAHPFFHVVCPILKPDHLFRSFYQKQN
jgi:hypothetical protein